MTLSGAFISYTIKLVLFAVVAGVGIAAGIRLRKAKDAKKTDKE